MKTFTLVRKEHIKDGIFGEMYFGDSQSIMFLTLEHAYEKDGKYRPKVPAGTYLCKKGMHKLSDLVPFETFELQKVPGHWGILFHVGNYNRDSSGCILIGKGRGFTSTRGKMIVNSKKAFAEFMAMLKDDEEFTLIVR